MKKFISVLAAVCMLVASTSAFAATVGDLKTDNGVQGVRNNVSALSENEDGTLPCFRPGDVLNFEISGLTSGKILTLISYKVGDGIKLGNDTIQYIDQQVIDGESSAAEATDAKYTVKYKIRDIDEGIYKIAMNANDSTAVLNFYYKVGDPKIELVEGTKENSTDKTSYYKMNQNSDGSYSIAFIGKVSLGSSDVSLTDAGVNNVGFTFTGTDDNAGKSHVSALSAESLQTTEGASNKIEANGSITYYYGLTMYGVPSDNLNNLGFTVQAGENLKTTTAEGGSN